MERMARGLVVTLGLVGVGFLVIGGIGGCSTPSAGAAAAIDGSAEAAAVVVDAPGDALLACTTAADCSSLFSEEPLSGSSVPCCTDKICRFEPYDGCTDASAVLLGDAAADTGMSDGGDANCFPTTPASPEAPTCST